MHGALSKSFDPTHVAAPEYFGDVRALLLEISSLEHGEALDDIAEFARLLAPLKHEPRFLDTISPHLLSAINHSNSPEPHRWLMRFNLGYARARPDPDIRWRVLPIRYV